MLSLCGSLVLTGTGLAAYVDTTDSVYRDTITPLGALWRSAILPGWGQLYYGSLPKAVLFFGASAAVGGIVVWNNTRFLDADRRYAQYDSTDGRKLLALREREFYRDQRDIAAMWLLAIYAFNVMDAYVGGHMASFTLGERAQVELLPLPGMWSIRLRW
ncbi:MAG: DUF5683 domain-containing protein [Bacteroidota bacterium]|nr:DUF5683 domain-containing protein [Candidatus Kapabacteria bacterium]MCS7303211.1 DUF5683 domain-containing protein [Candidatus Kapabacteria bacterium]MDW8074225.1 DUF5683 domain-containing protein [Bacteroidota bacterium]MDW8271299.1 DUF5683 domain-containing protein [Bacteroidota bacterium]